VVEKMKMIKGVIQPGPCLACGATGKWDPEMYDDPEDFIQCEFCSGTGYSQTNHTVIEREIGQTKLGKVIQILSDLYDIYIDSMLSVEDNPSDIDTLIDINEDEHIQAGILTAVLYRSGKIDRTHYSQEVMWEAWHLVLEAYDWEYDMKFKRTKDLRAGGSGWHLFEKDDL